MPTKITTHRSIQKRSFLLFELLIALTLIALCLLPLIKPHASMRIAERKQLEEMELERLAQSAFCEFKTQLYEQQLHWKQLKKGIQGTLPNSFTTSFGKEYVCHYKTEPRGYCNKKSYQKQGLLIALQLQFPPSATVFERTVYLEKGKK